MFKSVMVNINTDCFLHHHYHIYFEKKGKQVVRAYEADFKDKKKHIISAIGEFFEREILINYNPLNMKSCTLINMVTGEKTIESVGNLVFVDNFVDSCGMASHYLSEEVLWNAYKEFFERQSFITTFLFELESKEVEISSHGDLSTQHNYLLNYVDKVEYYDISLCKDLHVVLSIAVGKNRKAAGLGTSRDIVKAVSKSQKEILQHYAVAKSKRNVKEEIENKESKKDIYHMNFEKITVEEFSNYYNFLRNSTKVSIEEIQCLEIVEKDDIIIENYNSLGMEPYIVVFASWRQKGVKVIKLYDYKWFPHMRPELFDVRSIEYVSAKIKKSKQKEVMWIPFA